MGAGVAEEGEVRGRRRWPRVLAVLAGLLALALLGLWLARKPLAQGEVDRLLADARVPGRYTIADLGLGRQRLTDVVLGDPARPDLVADWLETRTAWGLSGPYLAGVRGGRVRVRARWADGRLSLGALDRLLPRGEAGKPFSLPALGLEIADLRARIDTPWGVVGAKLMGEGRLDGGFQGRLALTAARLGRDCAVERPEAVWSVRTIAVGPLRPARVELEGATQGAGLACGAVRAGYWNANGTATATLGERPGWATKQDVAATDLRHPAATARALAGRIDLASSDRLAGTVDLTGREVRASGVRAARVAVAGDVRGGPDGQGFSGELRLAQADARGAVPRFADAGAGTPLGPILAGLDTALNQAARTFAARATIAVDRRPNGVRVQLIGGAIEASSGARVTIVDGPGGELRPDGRIAFAGALTAGGGGLPGLTARLRYGPDGAIQGVVNVAPYAVGDARLALTPVRFSAGGGAWRVITDAELSGPLPDGRVEGLRLPVDVRWRDGALRVAQGCVPVEWRSVALSGLRLDPGALRLCAGAGPLLTAQGGVVRGAARLGATRLTGRLGASPLALTATSANLRLADRGFTLRDVTARLGTATRATLLSVATLQGSVQPGGVGGQFAGAGGRIGSVPLVMSDAAGRWRFGQGLLALNGDLTVSDAQTERPRLRPMTVREVALTLRGSLIEATGTARAPTDGRKVADLRIRHDLTRGAGGATIAVPGLAFDKQLQPDQLTPLTFGVIADVRGTMTGEGRIDWTPEAVTSSGVFRTGGTDLAAAFGPVTGLAGEIRFTDLLAVVSAPGQRATVKSINPGVPVTDGVVTYRTLANSRVQVEGARWPFAGGALTLDPTLLDFSGPAERRLTFHVVGADAGKFLQTFDFENLNATGVFDGTLPMVFDATGGRIRDGRLTVREGGGTIAYVGELSRKNLGFWGNYAFDALKSLRYRSLDIVMNGPLAGEMVTEVRFAGVTQGEGARSNFLIRRLQRLPLVFNVRIRAPFRGLLDATASLYDPKRLIERNLPELIERQNRGRDPAIQPPASETVP
jgi:translocation and assembly module TamB